jgi:predicted transcriptional regulator
METISITAERKAQLEEYAHRSGQDTAAALDVALAEYLAWEKLDFQQAVEGIREGYADMQAGRTQPVEEMFEELRVKHGLSR